MLVPGRFFACRVGRTQSERQVAVRSQKRPLRPGDGRFLSRQLALQRHDYPIETADTLLYAKEFGRGPFHTGQYEMPR